MSVNAAGSGCPRGRSSSRRPLGQRSERNGMTSRLTPAGEPPAAHESSTLAKLAVALLIGGLVWLAWKAFRLMAGAQEVKKHANYSFERN